MSITILVADDSPSLRQMVAFTLKGAGYRVIEAVDGQDAHDKAKNNRVNLVLTDVNMPRMNGLQLLEILRKMPFYQSIPILILTTESSQDMKIKGRDAGATGWLVKPFNPNNLLEVIDKVVQ